MRDPRKTSGVGKPVIAFRGDRQIQDNGQMTTDSGALWFWLAIGAVRRIEELSRFVREWEKPRR